MNAKDNANVTVIANTNVNVKEENHASIEIVVGVDLTVMSNVVVVGDLAMGYDFERTQKECYCYWYVQWWWDCWCISQRVD